MLAVAAGSPRLDYDAGLRYVLATVTAVGATALSTSIVVNVTVQPVNEGTSACTQ